MIEECLSTHIDIYVSMKSKTKTRIKGENRNKLYFYCPIHQSRESK